MLTSGSGAVQKSAAAAQNSRLGTGGSRHRHVSAGEWVDHGHHALMRISAFEAVGGYDETFSHNEDAELDYRLKQSGYRIWLSGRTRMVYYPRASLKGLFVQYLGYGRGRARNVLKHRVIPKVRQMVPLLVFPVVLLASLSFVHWLAAVPLLVWASVCLGYGLWTAIRQRNADIALAGVSAMIMHLGWSVGFWLQLLGLGTRRGVA
jgi:succinoglycan biosynthesis protein ExoA